MLSQHISQLIKNHFQYVPTGSQIQLINGFGEFITLPETETMMLIKGYAGTGKTSLVSALVKALCELEISPVLLAPTGRAAKVFSSYAKQPAYTIHKMIYRQKTSGEEMGRFNLNWNKYKDTLFIVDEASMIANSSAGNSIFGSGFLLEDLLQFIQQGNNCKLIIIGDSAQLPPVGFNESPALEVATWQAYGYNVSEFFLDEVIRQSADSGILHNATVLRACINDTIGDVQIPELSVSSFSDVERLSGEDLIEKISSCYDKYGVENNIVICRSNKRAVLYNKGIRGSILYREEELTQGDYLMVVKNNYFWTEKCKEIDFIANGDVAEIIRIQGYEELYGYRFANVSLRFLDYEHLELDVKIILDVLTIETPTFSKEQNQHFYQTVLEDYTDLKSKRKQFEEMRKNPYFNAVQVKYGYALTCHKSQGGQWDTVFIDQGMIREEDKGADYVRWLYTAMTRASKKLYLINFPDDQFKQ